MANQRSLSSFLEALPQELYDLVYHETFTTAPNKTFNTDPINKKETPILRHVILISKPTRPPSVMQVDRNTRSKVMESYYSNTFIFGTPDLCKLWLRSLSPACSVQNVGLVVRGEDIDQPEIDAVIWLIQQERFCMKGDWYLPASMECLKDEDGVRAVTLRKIE